MTRMKPHYSWPTHFVECLCPQRGPQMPSLPLYPTTLEALTLSSTVMSSKRDMPELPSFSTCSCADVSSCCIWRSIQRRHRRRAPLVLPRAETHLSSTMGSPLVSVPWCPSEEHLLEGGYQEQRNMESRPMTSRAARMKSSPLHPH